MVRLAAYGGLSTAAAAYVVLSAFRQRSNFFAAAVYLSKSNASMMLLWNFGIFLTVIFGRGVQTVFFGPLRLIEVERMHERIWYAITESLLALTIFREAFDTSFVILFVSLLFLKVFHWLASDRIEMMEQAPTIPRLFHMRMVTVLSTLWLIDSVLVAVAADSILTEGPSVMIMFASEYMILLATLLGTTLKYGANAYDLRNDIPWENKSVFIFYVELACDFLKLATYLCFFSLILTFYGLPLNILRDVYITARSFITKVRDLSRYRQATRNMDQRYPNASAGEMERLSDKTCIICREDMEARTEAQNQARDSRQGPNDTPKKLPCGHIFHFHCLRSWLERQQSCPTCRRPVLSSSAPQVQQPATPAAAAPAQIPAAHAARPTQQTGASTVPPPTSSVPRNYPLANGHLSVPSSSTPHSAGAASNGSRRRAGPENPLIAFQLRSASKPPANTEGNVNSAAATSGLPLQGVPQTSTEAPPAGEPKVKAPPAAAADPSTSSQATKTESPSVIGTDMEAQRRQRLEAALRRRGFGPPDSIGSATQIPVQSDSLPSKQPTPTPSIKIDDASNLDKPTSLSLGTTPPVSEGEGNAPHSLRTIKIPTPSSRAPLARVQSDHITPLDSRASSPVTILNPMGAFGGRAVPSRAPQVTPFTESSPSLVHPIVEDQSSSWPIAFSPSNLPQLSVSDMPRLIPLFDPSDPSKPSSLTRFLPSLIRSGIWPSGQQASGQQSTQPDMVHLPPLDEGQLASLAEVTREGLETRLKLLNTTQGTLQACIGQLEKAMEILDTRDVQRVMQTAAEISRNSPEQSAHVPVGDSAKGKGRAPVNDSIDSIPESLDVTEHSQH